MVTKAKKALLIGLISALMLCLLGATSEKGTTEDKTVYNGEEIYNRSHQAVFYLRGLNEDASLRAAGTGFVITTDGYALTAAHVIKEAFMLNAEFENGSTYENIKVIYVDTKTDVAVLKLPNNKESYPFISFAETPPQYGSVLYAIGYPLKTIKLMVNGIVASPNAKVNEKTQMLMTVPLSNGMSGGPIIDENGYAVGISSGTLRTMSGISFSPTTEQIRSIMNQVVMEG
jgi:S1-C subfamily serine protease